MKTKFYRAEYSIISDSDKKHNFFLHSGRFNYRQLCSILIVGDNGRRQLHEHNMSIYDLFYIMIILAVRPNQTAQITEQASL